MRLVVGLGNPGEKYSATRHNIGFVVVDRLHVSSSGSTSFRPQYDGSLALSRVDDREVALLKPQTFMNRSGRSVHQALEHLELEPQDMVVIHDDLDLELGTVRVKRGGGSGGHRGLESCFVELGTREFVRVRVGIGRPPSEEQSATDYVLLPFDEAQREALPEVVNIAADAVRETVTVGAVAAMNRFNRRSIGVGDGGEP